MPVPRKLKIKPNPELPICPGCNAVMDLFQPDEQTPGRLMGACHNPDCRTWATFEMRHNGLWVVVQRTKAPPMDRPPPQTAPERPIAAKAG
jgi:ssDNA-binding Zn-finger/Zn-ribbon topoisomerase 1